MPDQPATLRRWHAVVASKNLALLTVPSLANHAIPAGPACFSLRLSAWAPQT